MTGLDADILRRLGAGETIAAVLEAAGLGRAEFDAQWQAELARRLPRLDGTRQGPLAGRATIQRDRWGVAHVSAATDPDMFFGLGYAVAQDRLFQLDWYRRRALGQVSEILGPSGLADDTVSRIVGLNRIAAAQTRALSDEHRSFVEAYAAGINAFIAEAGPNLPIEFALLDYAPRPWTAMDSIAIAVEFAYYLSVRLPVIVLPELARRHLKDEALLRAFLTGEAVDETILPRGAYPAATGPVGAVSHSAGDPDSGGSNNWVVDGRLSSGGKPLLASDPHIGFQATSHWYETRLTGKTFDVGGVSFVGVPGIRIGRTRGVAWGVTNNASCSQRDLYQEKTDPAHPGAFLFDGTWEAARTLTETIRVKGAADVVKTVTYSRNGPIVDELLGLGKDTGPVSLKWLGDCDASPIASTLEQNRAETCTEFRDALKLLVCPSNCLVFGDTQGHIGFHATGTIPLRRSHARGYRPGWDPAHQWTGVIPWEGAPQLADPPRGWIASANNPPAPDDFPYPLSGVWTSGERARRCRELLEGRPHFDVDAFKEMHHDALSIRARRAAPMLATILAKSADAEIRAAGRPFVAWDHRIATGSIAATLFEAFTLHWSRRVAEERFPAAWVATVSGSINGLAMELLQGDAAGWFAAGKRDPAIEAAMRRALDDLKARLGDDMERWQYGRLHRLQLRHYLSARGDLGALLDRAGPPTPGSHVTVCNTSMGPNYESNGGATCRFIADLSTSPPEFWNVLPQGASGNIGSPHYCDQSEAWAERRYHRISFDGPDPADGEVRRLVIEPA